ncbi:MAG: hypothetical protein KBG15_18980 [Kofleriaceae bacterium]|nr:hypothetical protein [Kofleriaceae bacterium]
MKPFGLSGAVALALVMSAVTATTAEALEPPPTAGAEADKAADISVANPTATAPPAAPAPPPALLMPHDLSHQGQFGLSLRTAATFRWLTPYDGADFCGERSADTASGNSPVCLGRAPLSLDFEFSYGATSKADAILELRLGVERDFAPAGNAGTAGPRIFHLAPGVRYYYSEGKTSKLFTTAQLVLDLTGYKDATGQDRGVDFGVRSINGLWFDLRRSLSAYVFVGGTLTAVRWLRVDVEGGVGVQFRYPS